MRRFAARCRQPAAILLALALAAAFVLIPTQPYATLGRIHSASGVLFVIVVVDLLSPPRRR